MRWFAYGCRTALIGLAVFLDPVVPTPGRAGVGSIAASMLARGEAIAAPPLAEAAWKELVACSGIVPKKGKGFARIQWVSVPGAHFHWPGVAQQAVAIWLRRGNTILIAEGRMDDTAILKHEMLHALLGDQPLGREHAHKLFEPGNDCGVFPHDPAPVKGKHR